MGLIIPIERIRKRMKKKEYIERDAVIEFGERQLKRLDDGEAYRRLDAWLNSIPSADVRPVPDGGIGEMSDGYHTFNGLYYQRMVLFAALVQAHKDKAWKSWKHEDGELCFGGGWFIVGIDTPEGSYTYHYEDKDWDRFECEELPVARHWDGHTEEDVTRLLSLAVRPVVTCADCKYNTREVTDLCGNNAIQCITGLTHRPDWFCADGKKREES